MTLHVGVVVPAAGAGTRMGGLRKAFLDLAGTPVLLRAIRPFLDRPDVTAVAVALAPDDAAHPPDWLVGADPRVRVVAGGDHRAASVLAGMNALPEAVDAILVHDGARPLVTARAIERCLEEVARRRGAVVGWPAVDTLKEVDPGDLRIVATPDRRRYWHAQTPQGFPRAMIEAAYRGARTLDGATDDASLVERAGHEVVMVEGDPWNIKVTRPEDLALAEFILKTRSS